MLFDVRMVAEIFTERKLKTQKNKPKSSEGRMHLTNIRVVQRNLVYIIGLPLNLADEEARTFCNTAFFFFVILDCAALSPFCQNSMLLICDILFISNSCFKKKSILENMGRF